MTKRFFLWLGKAAVAGILAFLLLSLFCFFYSNIPIHYTNPTGSTEYRWEAGRFYSRFTEGFALGKTNNDGFNNLRDYTPGEQIDVLLMGSSHMEAFNDKYDQEFGQQTRLNAVNVTNPKQFEVKTPSVVIKVNSDRTDLVETRVIDGHPYILIRADEGVEVNGVNVNLPQ